MSWPSILRLLGGFVPASAAKVGKKSSVAATLPHVVPAGIFPGHHITHGSRIPPSYVVPFPPRNGRAEPPAPPRASHGPLSDVKITSVFLSSFNSCSVSTTWPTLQASSSTASPNAPRWLLPLNLADASSGV